MELSVRKELHRIIDEADDVRLGEIYDWLHEGVPDSIKYSPAEIQMFYQRLDEYAMQKADSYTMEESFTLVRNNMA